MEIQKDIKLTYDELDMLDSYKTMCEGLSAFLGDGFEFLVYSLEGAGRPAVKISNGQYTGIAGSTPPDSDIPEIIDKAFINTGNKYVSCFRRNKKGIPLKTSAITLCGQCGRPIALLIVNFYLNTPVSQLLSCYCPSAEQKEDPNFSAVHRSFSSDSDEVLADIVKNVRRQVASDSDISAVNKNREIIWRLYRLGLFKIKNSVQCCADLLGISRNTVYMHIRNINRNT